MKILSKLPLDTFILSILATVLVAAIFPASEYYAPFVDHAVTIAIAILFFLYGLRLKPQEALEGLKHWRLHLLILSITFIVFPLIGYGFHFLSFLPGNIFLPDILAGLIYVTLLPSTVQSSIAFTTISGGNMAGAVVSASASNLLGIVFTPMLVILFSTLKILDISSGSSIDFHSVFNIMIQLLLPFILGQIARIWLGKWAKDNESRLKRFDRVSILLVVYSAFSMGMREHIWSKVGWIEILALIIISILLVLFMLWFSKTTAKKLGFNHADQIAIQFCGTKKSLATGLPMAYILFAGHSIGILILPLMIFHQTQLMTCSTLAGRYEKKLKNSAGSTIQAA